MTFVASNSNELREYATQNIFLAELVNGVTVHSIAISLMQRLGCIMLDDPAEGGQHIPLEVSCMAGTTDDCSEVLHMRMPNGVHITVLINVQRNDDVFVAAMEQAARENG